ncbi:DUF4157 domain-containing protein [Bradyrhizobium diazoefficiens]|nr:DUF4157 domain-containing protein [Bradyrhizobium diazoefficiens]MBR0774304.1 DUF4157 domain-containing protein [Bradyrhizobium diazoefficiens]
MALTSSRATSQPATTSTNRAIQLQRKCACGAAAGKDETCDDCKAEALQRKSADEASRDPLEYEADRAADRVTAGRQAEVVGRTGRSSETTAPASVERTLEDPGAPLESSLRRDMERQFRADFSSVRIHAGEQAARSAQAINAQAYTAGRSIAFGAGKYEPASHEGRHLIAHELTHVLQQSRTGGTAAIQRKGRTPGGFLANIFQFWDYSPKQLNTYLKELDDTQDIQNDDDSDDMARQIVREWKSDHGKFNLTSARKALLIREMVTGEVFESDREGIMTLLNSSETAAELAYFFGAGGVRHRTLLDQFGKDHRTELMDFYRRRFDVADEKELDNNPEPLQQPKEAPKGPVLTYQQALLEAGAVLQRAGFGKVCGSEIGPDEGDHYDAREWKEIGREKLVATTEAWLAFKHFVDNIGKDVPNSTGGKTKWKFDCYGAGVATVVYADWRMMTREEFNKKYTPLEFGIDSRVNKRWENTGPTATKPGEKPFTYVEGHREGGVIEQAGEIQLKKSMKVLLNEAPIGSKVVWSNIDALDQCNKHNWLLRFCNYANENTIKVGQDQYSAHPFGVVNEDHIRKEMAKAMFPDKPVPADYIEKNIFVFSIRHPRKSGSEST